MSFGVANPEERRDVGAIPCGRLYINGQGRATAPTYRTPSFRGCKHRRTKAVNPEEGRKQRQERVEQ